MLFPAAALAVYLGASVPATLINALRLLRSRGIRPVLYLGPIPRALCARPQAGSFLWNTAASSDYAKYTAYVKALFLFLAGPAGFTRKEVETWRLQLWREPDNHESGNPRREDLDLRVRLRGLKPGGAYALRLYRVDRDRGQYLGQWLRDLKAAGETLQVPYDACMKYRFSPSQWALWRRNRPAYEALTRLDPLPGPSSPARADPAGALAETLPLSADSVTLAEWTPAGKARELRPAASAGAKLGAKRRAQP